VVGKVVAGLRQQLFSGREPRVMTRMPSKRRVESVG
jgi:hypothetical protein